MRRKHMKRDYSNPIPPEIQSEINALIESSQPPRTDLIPEATGDWSQAKRGLFYRPVEQQITL
jgi:hypothetical protein